MGVVNVTPDSFSDGGRFLAPDSAVAQAAKLAAEGADILDIGAESTRPGATPVSEAEELRRLLPVLERVVRQVSIPISVDTMKVEVARAALDAGASIINDVGAARQDRHMAELIASHRAGYVCIHMQGTPLTMQKNPVYQDVVAEVEVFFQDNLDRLCSCGVAREQIILDPGIGFGKKIEHNLKLLGALGRFRHLDRPLLLGVSRKSFLGKVSGGQPEHRLVAGLACASLAVASGVQLIRTHDVAETVQAIRTIESILAQSKE
jgi:dihydropteroate synthase